MLVVNTNIQGQKSDARIRQTINHQAIIREDGTILDSVTITREHTGDPAENLYGGTNINYVRVYVPEGSELITAGGFGWPDESKFRVPESWYQKDDLLGKLEKEEAVDPKTGTRITKEFGKTVFGNWAITEPGQKSTVHFVYKLPFRAFDANAKKNENAEEKIKNILLSSTPTADFQLIVQRQSGSESSLESQIVFPDGWSPAWHEGSGMKEASNGAFIQETALYKDNVWSLLMHKK